MEKKNAIKLQKGIFYKMECCKVSRVLNRKLGQSGSLSGDDVMTGRCHRLELPLPHLTINSAFLEVDGSRLAPDCVIFINNKGK